MADTGWIEKLCGSSRKTNCLLLSCEFESMLAVPGGCTEVEGFGFTVVQSRVFDLCGVSTDHRYRTTGN